MGGVGSVIQIDECYMRGRRKNNVGRLQRGNRVPPACSNYGRAIVGPWVFGMIWYRGNGKKEVRFFSVLRRDVKTLRPLIQQHIAPGSEIWSDEWRAYTHIPIRGAITHTKPLIIAYTLNYILK